MSEEGAWEDACVDPMGQAHIDEFNRAELVEQLAESGTFCFGGQTHRSRTKILGSHKEALMSISMEKAIEVLKSAFYPMRCEAEIWDYGQKIRFRVFDDDNKALLRMEDITKSQATDPDSLANLIGPARESLARRGHELQEWSNDSI